MRTLIATWLVTLGVIAALAVWLELSYEPEVPVSESHQIADANLDTSPDTTADTGPDTTMDTPEPSADHTDDAPIAPEINPADATMNGSFDAAAIGDDDNAAVENMPSGSTSAATVSPDMLFEDGPYGPLPISISGLQPWRAFGTPSDVADRTPRIAIILSGLGLNARVTQKAILETPPEITLAFSPYGQSLSQFAEDGARMGHEMLIMIPMEPNDYPVNDPGPHSLLTSLSGEQNLDRLHFLLARFKGYVGLINDMGSRFTSSGNSLRPIMADLQRRGLLFVDARSSSASVAIAVAQDFGVPWAENTRFIDHRASGSQIDKALADLERMARLNGLAIGVGHPYPITVERLISWAPTLADKGIALVPITATAMKRTVR